MHFTRITHLAIFEIGRLFASKRGWLAMFAFAICWFLLLRYPIANSVAMLESNDLAGFSNAFFGFSGLSNLLSWPAPELISYWLIALFSFPVVCLFICGDQIVGDKQRGTLRFLSLRTTRTEILLGRFIGQVFILSILLLATILGTLLIITYRESALFVSAVAKSIGIFGYLLVSVMPFIALMSFFNSFAGSARLAFVFAVLFFGVGNIVVSLLVWQIPMLDFLYWVFPGYQLDEVAAQKTSILLGVGLPLLQTVILLCLAQRMFARSAI